MSHPGGCPALLARSGARRTRRLPRRPSGLGHLGLEHRARFSPLRAAMLGATHGARKPKTDTDADAGCNKRSALHRKFIESTHPCGAMRFAYCALRRSTFGSTNVSGQAGLNPVCGAEHRRRPGREARVLFEPGFRKRQRRAAKTGELRARPGRREAQGTPTGAPYPGGLLFGYFLLAAQEKVPRRAGAKARIQYKERPTGLHQTQQEKSRHRAMLGYLRLSRRRAQ